MPNYPSTLGVLILVGRSFEGTKINFGTKYDLFKANLERDGYVVVVQESSDLPSRSIRIFFRNTCVGDTTYEVVRQKWEINMLLSNITEMKNLKPKTVKKKKFAKKAQAPAYQNKDGFYSAALNGESSQVDEFPATVSDSPPLSLSPSPSPSPIKPKPRRPASSKSKAKEEQYQEALHLATVMEQIKSEGTNHLRQAAETLRQAAGEPAMAGTPLMEVVTKLVASLEAQAMALASVQVAAAAVVISKRVLFPAPSGARTSGAGSVSGSETGRRFKEKWLPNLPAKFPSRPLSARGPRPVEREPLPPRPMSARGNRPTPDMQATKEEATPDIKPQPTKRISRQDEPRAEPVLIMGKGWGRPFLAKNKREEKAARLLSFRVPFH